MMKTHLHETWDMERLPTATWMPRALCRGQVDRMVPQRYNENGHRVHPDDYEAAVIHAKKLCDVCAVQAPCRSYGLAVSRRVEDHGVYGSLTMEEREQLIGYSMRFNPLSAVQRPCGTAGAYRRHMRRGEQPCDLCRAFRAEDQRERRHRKRSKTSSTKGGGHGKSVETQR